MTETVVWKLLWCFVWRGTAPHCVQQIWYSPPRCHQAVCKRDIPTDTPQQSISEVLGKIPRTGAIRSYVGAFAVVAWVDVPMQLERCLFRDSLDSSAQDPQKPLRSMPGTPSTTCLRRSPRAVVILLLHAMTSSDSSSEPSSADKNGDLFPPHPKTCGVSKNPDDNNEPDLVTGKWPMSG